MKSSNSCARLATVALASCVLAACGGGGGGSSGGGGSTSSSNPYGGSGSSSGPTSSGAHVALMALASDGSTPAAYTDASLKNTWGLVFNPAGFAWVADNGSNKSTLYNGNGIPESPVVAIPAGTAGAAQPTGIVYNGSQSFSITEGAHTAPAQFIFAGLSGTISGWSATVDLNNAVTGFDGGAAGDEFTGLGIGSANGIEYLYAADFHHGTVLVLNSAFTSVALTGNFTDPTLPAGYAPFNIQVINNIVYVMYAEQNAGATDAVVGASLGVVAEFNTDGTFIKELITGGALNAPWGIALAPKDFGPAAGDLLIANLGDGTINAFNPSTGALVGPLKTTSGAALSIDGLWGIAFGNGINNQPTNTLFYAAGPSIGAHGVFGRVDQTQ